MFIFFIWLMIDSVIYWESWIWKGIGVIRGGEKEYVWGYGKFEIFVRFYV